MAELEVDQSNLPRVQEVCQCFAVLEDGALAHNLQEQEIEQYYTSNVQRNKLVQKDIRVAKRLQDEEEHTAHQLQQQATRHLEERDSEYARMIQEDLQRHAEEARRREVEDEEIAKRIQEEEELCVRHRGSYQNRDGRETTSVPVPPYSPRAVHTPHTEYRCYKWSPTRRWQHSPSPPCSDSEEDLIGHSRPAVVTNRSQTYQDCRSTVGPRQLISYSRLSRSHLDQDNRSTTSQSGSTVSQKSRTLHLSGGWGDVIKLIKNDLSEQGYLSHSSEDELFEPVYKLERILKQKQQASDQRSSGGSRLSRHSSVREDGSRTWQGDGGERERHVHFLDERRRINSYHGNGYSLNDNSHNTRERGEVGGSLSAGALRDSRTHPRESLGDLRQTQAQGFQRNISMRRSYHGDVRLSRRTSVRGGNRRGSQDDSNLVNGVRPNNTQLMEMENRGLGPLREAGRNQHQRAHSTEEERMIDRDHGRYNGQHRVRRSQSEHGQSFEEERLSTEELERESRREVRRMQRLPPHSISQSCSGRSPRAAGPAVRSGTAALDLGDLEQVLLDEELARRLQEEEERLAGETQQCTSLRRTCPEDFRIAQVVQDEEIARFIQKQEIKAKRRSHELDPVGPRQEYGYMMTEYDRRAACDRQLQKERMDSDGLQSSVDDLASDHPSSSPVSMGAQPQPIRNIAEQLDPTFQRKEIAEAAMKNNGTCQNQGSQQVGSYNPIEEQPTFVPPTKRPNDKLGRVKPKDPKKENIKQRENCKQQ